MTNGSELVAMTVRFDKGAYNVIGDVAKRNGVSKADIVRFVVDNKLEKYLSDIRYIDENQGRTINKNIIKIGNILVSIRDELNRIGVNYNQEVRLKNLQNKIREKEQEIGRSIKNGGVPTMKLMNEKDALEDQKLQIENSSSELKREELLGMMMRMEEIVKEVGDMLCTLE